ncbi:MAG: copper amine oxidase N-terminal domain-containing protein, partial [Clostridiales bacterium]|nr:copper amine oxidase N-terminal domain-containing protein [Clostridiales bacterium]
MRKLIAAILILAFVAAPAIAYANDNIGVTIDGQPVVFAGQPPAIVDGRTLVPVRGVFEQLGFDVNWDGATRRAILTRGGTEVVIPVGSAAFTVNGARHGLDVPAQIIGGSTMLPIRDVLESVGYAVGWDDATRTVVITTIGISDYGRRVAEEFLSQMTTIFTGFTVDTGYGRSFVAGSGAELWAAMEGEPQRHWAGLFVQPEELRGLFDNYGNRIAHAPYLRGNSRIAYSFTLHDFDGSGIPEIIVHFISFDTIMDPYSI